MVSYLLLKLENMTVKLTLFTLQADMAHVSGLVAGKQKIYNIQKAIEMGAQQWYI